MNLQKETNPPCRQLCWQRRHPTIIAEGQLSRPRYGRPFKKTSNIPPVLLRKVYGSYDRQPPLRTSASYPLLEIPGESRLLLLLAQGGGSVRVCHRVYRVRRILIFYASLSGLMSGDFGSTGSRKGMTYPSTEILECSNGRVYKRLISKKLPRSSHHLVPIWHSNT